MHYVSSIQAIKNRTPARILAKQTGAAQFEEHIEQSVHRDCNEHNHRLRKRSSDEDLDYEVYQGVVGRPGIDFPIFPRIPQTTFSCRSYGNGYFADLETTCQVFHICEEGRKISFLCPNGTIFQQSELTCDWWFKVNCAGSPGFYAESSEILSKSRRHRLKVNGLHKGYTNTNKIAEIIPETRIYKGSDRRIDSNENPSVESFDFEDVSDDKSNDKSVDRSIDTSNDRTNYKTNNKPIDRPILRSKERSKNRSSDRHTIRINNRLNEKIKIQKEELLTDPLRDDNHNQHTEQNYPELQITAESSSFVKNPRINSFTHGDKTKYKNKESEIEIDTENPSSKQKDIQISKISSTSRGSQKHNFSDSEQKQSKTDNEKPTDFYITSRPDIKLILTTGKVNYFSTSFPEYFTVRDDRTDIETSSTLRPDFFANSPISIRDSTPSQNLGTYSTARRIDITRTTPFYTPTIPSILRTRPTESKTSFVNVSESDEPTALRRVISEYSTSKPLLTTEKPANSDTQRFFIFSNKDLNLHLPAHLDTPTKSAENSLGSSTSGPTYLPESEKAKSGNLVTPANTYNSITRNVEGILQTVGVLNETMKHSAIDDKNSSPRVGLEIPPSSGPGTLISLTNYFANDDEIVSTTSSNEKTTTTKAAPLIDISTSLLSNKTSGKYLNLFGIVEDKSTYSTSASTEAPQIVYSPTIVGDFTRTTIRDLVQDPETRKIAQVFSNAISKYIENPETFRKDLIDVRPQPPTNVGISRFISTTPSSFKVSTDKKSIVKTNTISNNQYNYSQNTSTLTTNKDETETSDSNDIAKEINSQFDVSTPAYDSILPDIIETTTFSSISLSLSAPQTTNIETLISSELLPPNLDDDSEHESLYKVQSQSFVKSYNDLTKNSFDRSIEIEKQQTENPGKIENPSTYSTIIQTDKTKVDKSLTNTEGPYSQTDRYKTSTGKTQKYNPWLKESEKKLKQSIDAATLINKPSALNHKANGSSSIATEKKTVEVEDVAILTNSGIKPTENPWSQITQSIYLDPLTINDGLVREQITTTSKPIVAANTDRSRFEDISQGEEDIEDILNSSELSSELFPKKNGLQRIANKLFGGLNETEAIHLQNVMKKAEHNQNVLRLLLLLIQTCDDQNGKALERSRKILLNALIGMDDKFKIKHISYVSATTHKIPVTTYHRVLNDKHTTTTGATTTELLNENEETTKFEIRVPDPEDEEENKISTAALRAEYVDRNPSRTSDERALQLLKSLYSLASKFSRR